MTARDAAGDQAKACLADVWEDGYTTGWVDCETPHLPRTPNPHRCGAPHPSNPTVIPCRKERGHSGFHWSTTGCAGPEIAWDGQP